MSVLLYEPAHVSVAVFRIKYCVHKLVKGLRWWEGGGGLACPM